jgi:hypothetical protein
MAVHQLDAANGLFHLIPIERPDRLAGSLARFGAEIGARR